MVERGEASITVFLRAHRLRACATAAVLPPKSISFEWHSLLGYAMLSNQIGPCTKGRALRHFVVRRSFEQFVNQRLVRFVLARGQTPKPRKKPRMNSYGDQPLGVACFRSADAARALQFRIRRLGNIREINLAVGNMLCVLCGSTAARR